MSQHVPALKQRISSLQKHLTGLSLVTCFLIYMQLTSILIFTHSPHLCFFIVQEHTVMHTHIHIMNYTFSLALTDLSMHFKKKTHDSHIQVLMQSPFTSLSHLSFIMPHASLCEHTYEPCNIPCSKPYPYNYTPFTNLLSNIKSQEPCLHPCYHFVDSIASYLTYHPWHFFSFCPLPVFLHYPSKQNSTITKKTYHV
ncbi:hypothetical protein KP509_20G076000 [Ceratopteris richardii]|uniref:Uncharacterized protein n=1 Tax=Ceratopteris richardii TaxID=49495 RepID=A0A8T2SKD9_CERRI|nr:hypothetical protein KP509_20G076000 [Ceratopteris richardii]